MRKEKTPVFIVLLLVVAGVLILSGFVGNVSAAEDDRNLFRDYPGDMMNAKPANSNIVRSRQVDVNFDLFLKSDGFLGGTKIAESLSLNLFPDVFFIAVLDRLEKNPSGSYSWIGHIEGNPFNPVTLVVNDKIMIGNISAGDTLYAVRFSGESAHIIQEINRSGFGRD